MGRVSMPEVVVLIVIMLLSIVTMHHMKQEIKELKQELSQCVCPARAPQP